MAKQQPLLKDKFIPELDELVEDYQEKKKARMIATGEEVEAKQALIQDQQERKLTEYTTTDGLTSILKPKDATTDVKVTPSKERKQAEKEKQDAKADA